MFCFVFSPEGADVLKRKHASTDNRNLDFVSVSSQLSSSVDATGVFLMLLWLNCVFILAARS